MLGIKLANTSFPVGKVNFLHMYPMTFKEYLIACDKQNLLKYIEYCIKEKADTGLLSSELREEFNRYILIGGMPEVVKVWLETKDISQVKKVQQAIVLSYQDDFAKHTTATEANRISLVWKSIPSQLAKENKKFLFNAIKNGARAREYEDAVNWLNDVNIVNKIYNITKPEVPLVAYQDLSAFKLYVCDVGLLSYINGVEPSLIIDSESIFKEFKGALVENYIIQCLITNKSKTFYHTFENRYEIDCLIQYKNTVIPIEVKSGQNVQSSSLKNYTLRYNPKIKIRFSQKLLKKDDNLINIPLYMSDWLEEIINEFS